MKKMITVVGARPQIIKASAVSRAIDNTFSNEIQQLVVHTGQHYDHNMSEVFFDELNIPAPSYNLQVGSGSHAMQTATIIEQLENIFEKEQPDGVLVYGDTNSTVAAAITASKMQIPLIHIEAGLRSYNKIMPEEINRVLTDHVSTLLFCPTETAVRNLIREGIQGDHDEQATIDNPLYFLCGDIMFDNSLYFSGLSAVNSSILNDLGLADKEYILATIHRNATTDSVANLNSVFRAILKVQQETGLKMVLPLHPRTRKMMDTYLSEPLRRELEDNRSIINIPPAGFLDIIALEKGAILIMTDSGGLQKEAFFFQKPCVILRTTTEWIEIVENGNAILAGITEEEVVSATKLLLAKSDYTYPTIFGDGKAAEFIVKTIIQNI